jgi:hypothetical protein
MIRQRHIRNYSIYLKDDTLFGYFGKCGCSIWTLHMASIIIFSTVWGLALRNGEEPKLLP